jgi:hypothetical protein
LGSVLKVAQIKLYLLSRCAFFQGYLILLAGFDPIPLLVQETSILQVEYRFCLRHPTKSLPVSVKGGLSLTYPVVSTG